MDASDTGSERVPLIELDLLATLVAIGETNNFAAAARRIHRVPSSVSMQVKRLEDLVGCSLFVRSTRGVTLTAEGLRLVEHARDVLERNRDVMLSFIDTKIRGVVRLGMPPDDIVTNLLPAILRRFAANYPSITVEVIVDDSPGVPDQVRGGQLDLALLTKQASGLDTLWVEPLVWAGLRGGSAGTRTPLPLSLWNEDCSWRRASIAALDSIGRSWRPAFSSANAAAHRAAVLADLTIAPMPRSVLGDDIVDVGPDQGLPDLPDTRLGILVGADERPVVTAAAKYLRAGLLRQPGLD